MKTGKQIILLSSGFTGGFLAGYLVSSCQTSDRFQEQRERVEEAVSRFSHVLKESQERLRILNSRLKREVSDPFPDLYRATESLSLDENELIYD